VVEIMKRQSSDNHLGAEDARKGLAESKRNQGREEPYLIKYRMPS
jgi:hypothetical protein